MTHDVIPGRPFHVGAILRRMQPDQLETVTTLGVKAHQQLRDVYRASTWWRALMIDGELSGLGGVVGSALSSGGFIWLALSAEAMKRPRLLLTEARAQLAEILELKGHVTTCVAVADTKAARFAEAVGFVRTGPEDKGWLPYRLGTI